MIRTIQIHDLGVHEDTTLTIPEPRGWTVISGPSAAGKTHLSEALCALLWGCSPLGGAVDSSAVRDGKERMAIEVTTDFSYVIRCEMSHGRAWRRSLRRPRRPEDHARTREAWLDLLGPLGDPSLRVILVPMAWRDLIRSPATGRALRDAIQALLPEQATLDVVARLMQKANHEGAEIGVSLAAAETSRRAAGRVVTQAESRLQTLEEELADALVRSRRPAGPAAAQVQAAHRTLAVRDLWREYDRDLSAHETARSRAEERAAAIHLWERRLAAIGERPPDNYSGIQDARAAVAQAEEDERDAAEDVRELSDTLSGLRRELGEARHAQPPRAPRVIADEAGRGLDRLVAEMDGLPEDDSCPTCGRPGWEQAAESRRQLQERIDEARTAAQEASEQAESAAAAWREQQEAREAEILSRIEETRERRDVASGRLEVSREAVAAARDRLEAALALGGDAAAWDQQRRTLGDRPPDPPAAMVPPEAPEQDRPSQEQIDAARTTLRAADEAAGATGQRTQDLAGLRARVEEARGAADAARETHQMAACLVDCWRSAPSQVMPEAIARLARGPVSLRLHRQSQGDPTEDGISVYVHGRDWTRASDGELAVADLYLRDGLRRLAERRHSLLSALPLVVDRAQDLAGTDTTALEEWETHRQAVPGPVWLLLTVPGVLTVEAL